MFAPGGPHVGPINLGEVSKTTLSASGDALAVIHQLSLTVNDCAWDFSSEVGDGSANNCFQFCTDFRHLVYY